MGRRDRTGASIRLGATSCSGVLIALALALLLAASPAGAQETDVPAPVRAEDSVTVRGDEVPLANPGRFRLFLDETLLSPTLAPRLAFSAGLDQRSGTPRDWGTGTDGFGKRMAARAGLALAQSGVQHGTAALLRLDPRGDQSRCACTHPLRRTAHALARTFVTRDARGRAVPNVPLIAGAAGGAMIARAWYPRNDGPGRDAVRLATLTIVAQAGANVFREFAPEVKRLMRRR